MLTKILSTLLAILLAAREVWIRLRGAVGRARSAWFSE